MKHLHGQFESNNGTLYTLHIYNQNGNGEKIIGNDTVFFSPDPISIVTNADSEFTHIIKKSATISLITSENLFEYIFAENQNSVTVQIYKSDTLIFDGYVEPNIFSMPYAHQYDEIQINCLDKLSVLQYSKLSDIIGYDNYKKSAGISTFKEILNKIGLINAVYDGSKRKDVSDENIFEHLSISELIFLGDSEDKEMNFEEILFQILQYLNLHIIQNGSTFYIFDWNSQGTSIDWYSIEDGTYWTTFEGDKYNILKADYSSDGTNISVDDVYNQIQLKCDIEKLETVVESPLDNSNVYSRFSNYQKFLTQIYSKFEGTWEGGNGRLAWEAFSNYVKSDSDAPDTSLYWVRDWFFKVKDNDNWTFKLGNTNIYDTLYETDANNQYINQWKFLKYLRDNRFASAIISFAKGRKKQPSDIDTNDLSFTDYLVISVNGENLTNQINALSEFATDLQAVTPIIEYVGNSNGVYSPNDENTTNYIVFSGKLTLVPSIGNTGWEYYNDTAYATSNNRFSVTKNELINHDGDAGWIPSMQVYPLPYSETDNVYFCNKFWTQEKTIKDYPYIANPYYNFYYPDPDIPNTENEDIKYNLSKIDGQNYTIDKVPVLECELKIGDKYCVETFVQDAGGDYKNSVFNWYTYDECPTENGIKKTTFSLGIKPNVGDAIIGKEFDLQTNFDYTWNIEASDGTAIPITRADNLQGEVEFKILGLVNSTWDRQLTRKTRFWEYWFDSNTTKSILNYISSVMIKDFECKIYSDNNGYQSDSDNDLIYLSDVANDYIKKKDDIEFKLNTALTSEEAHNYGLSNTVNLSSVIDADSGYAVDTINEMGYSGNNMTVIENGKPEELYVNYYYNKFHLPKIIIETDVFDKSKFDWFNTFTIGYINKDFHIISQIDNLKADELHLKLREL